jgi:hypothetical protein
MSGNRAGGNGPHMATRTGKAALAANGNDVGQLSVRAHLGVSGANGRAGGHTKLRWRPQPMGRNIAAHP